MDLRASLENRQGTSEEVVPRGPRLRQLDRKRTLDVPFAAVPRNGCLVEISRTRPTSRFEHTLGGKNGIPGALCLPCKRPLLLMMSLDVRDRRLNLTLPRGRRERQFEGTPRDLHDIPLLYCWSCGPWLDYRVNPEGGVDVLNHSKEGSWPDSCWPYEPYPEEFPRKYLRLSPMSSRGQELIRRSNTRKLSDKERWAGKNQEFLKLKHQIGGEPLVQQ